METSVSHDEDDPDLPADVRETLSQLLVEAAEAARDRRTEAVDAAVETVETVTQTKVPRRGLREQLLHGCVAVNRLVADEPLVAAEYLEAMERLLEE